MKTLPVIPASFFGAVLGIMGLGSCWRLAAKIWSLPVIVGKVILFLGIAIWCLLIALYFAKWVWLRTEAIQELRHPIFCCFIGLVPATAPFTGLAWATFVFANLFIGWLLVASLWALAGGKYLPARGVSATG